MQELGKSMIIVGGVVVTVGLVILAFGKVPFFGRLPGDVMIKKENFSLYFPITTCILLSILLTVIMMLAKRH